jgi:hypothetical protein
MVIDCGMEKDLLIEIVGFLEKSGMSPSYFGKRACGNSELLKRLRDGKTVTLRTADRVRFFMAAHKTTGQRNIQRLECVDSVAGAE